MERINILRNDFEKLYLWRTLWDELKMEVHRYRKPKRFQSELQKVARGQWQDQGKNLF